MTKKKPAKIGRSAMQEYKMGLRFLNPEKPAKKKRSPQDLTLRNLRAMKKRIDKYQLELSSAFSAIFELEERVDQIIPRLSEPKITLNEWHRDFFKKNEKTETKDLK